MDSHCVLSISQLGHFDGPGSFVSSGVMWELLLGEASVPVLRRFRMPFEHERDGESLIDKGGGFISCKDPDTGEAYKAFDVVCGWFKVRIDDINWEVVMHKGVVPRLVRSLLQTEVAGVVMRHGWLVPPSGVGAGSGFMCTGLQLGDPSTGKGWCLSCNVLVRMDGHDQRCRLPSLVPAIMKKYAWVGHARWELYVRTWIVHAGCRMAEADKYITVSALASHYLSMRSLAFLDEQTSDRSSNTTLSQCVCSLLALSGQARVRLATDFGLLGGDLLSLWKPSMIYDDSLGFEVSPAFDGFCYLHLFEHTYRMQVTSVLGAFPLWEKVQDMLEMFGLDVCSVYFMVNDVVCHVSDSHFHGAVHYTGDPVRFPIPAAVAVGALVTPCSLSKLVVAIQAHPTWPEGVFDAVYRLQIYLVHLKVDCGFEVYCPQWFTHKILVLVEPKRSVPGGRRVQSLMLGILDRVEDTILTALLAVPVLVAGSSSYQADGMPLRLVYNGVVSESEFRASANDAARLDY